MPQYVLSELINPSIVAYNAYDVALTHEISGALSQLPEPGPIYNFSRALQGPVMTMMLRGILVNTHEVEKQVKLHRENLKIIEEILKKIIGAVWDEPWKTNAKGEATLPNSNTQLCNLFYSHLGIPAITKKIKGEVKMPMDRDILEKIQNGYFQARPIISLILAHRDTTGILEVLEAGIDEDHRIRSTINIASTSTGRFSSAKSTTGSGQNIQNITEDLRRIFVADKGKKIAAIDKSQAESREFGFLCGKLFDDWSYLDMIEKSDPHTYTARLVWTDLPWTGDIKLDRKIAEQPFYRHLTYRDMSKRCSHGTNYLGKPYTISTEIKVPPKLVANFQEKYFDAFPVVTRLHTWVAQELQTKGYLINVFGRRRDFFDRHESNETLKQAVAFLFQSATADDLNLGLWRLWNYMDLSGRIQLLLQLHDAVYFQYSLDDDEQDVITTAQKYLDVELFCGERKFIVPTEALIGFNFGHRFKLNATGKPIEVNPRGLDKPTWH
jgi:DNA polymerase I-like protein with 3'-5' exonuclease and polymerase domains